MNRLFHRIFTIGIWTKGISGVLEITGGILAFTVTKSTVIRVILLLTQQELVEDPQDAVATLLRHAVEHVTAGSKMFAGIYLIAHGAINMLLAIELLHKKLWSYPAAIGFLCLFIGYQAYRITLHHSFILTIATCLDMVIVLLIWNEYRVVR